MELGVEEVNEWVEMTEEVVEDGVDLGEGDDTCFDGVLEGGEGDRVTREEGTGCDGEAEVVGKMVWAVAWLA